MALVEEAEKIKVNESLQGKQGWATKGSQWLCLVWSVLWEAFGIP